VKSGPRRCYRLPVPCGQWAKAGGGRGLRRPGRWGMTAARPAESSAPGGQRAGRGRSWFPACSSMRHRARVSDSHCWAWAGSRLSWISLRQVSPSGWGCRPRTSEDHAAEGSAAARRWMWGNRPGAKLGVADEGGQQHHGCPVAGLVAILAAGQVGGVKGAEQPVAVGQPFGCPERGNQGRPEQVQQPLFVAAEGKRVGSLDDARRRQVHDASAHDIVLRVLCLGAGNGGWAGRKGCGPCRGRLRRLLAAPGAAGFVLRVDEAVDQVDVAAGSQWRQVSTTWKIFSRYWTVEGCHSAWPSSVTAAPAAGR